MSHSFDIWIMNENEYSQVYSFTPGDRPHALQHMKAQLERWGREGIKGVILEIEVESKTGEYVSHRIFKNTPAKVLGKTLDMMILRRLVKCGAGTKRPPPKPSRKHATVTNVLDAIKKKKTPQRCDPHFTEGPRFMVVASPGVRRTIRQSDVDLALSRFGRCDWGDVTAAVSRKNNGATRRRRGEIFGAYQDRNGSEFWLVLIFEKRSVGVMLPREAH